MLLLDADSYLRVLATYLINLVLNTFCLCHQKFSVLTLSIFFRVKTGFQSTHCVMENMGVNQCYEEIFSHDEMLDGDQSYLKEKSAHDPATVPDNCKGCFDCNICLDYARDPVVTLCGHLYCWPCIYKWIYSHSTSATADHQQQQCPVCKADVLDNTLVPLYGRGQVSPDAEPNSKDSLDLEIPCRPPAHGVHALITTNPNQQLHTRPDSSQSQFESDHNQNQQYNAPANSVASPMLSLRGTTAHPMIWQFGDIVSTTVFRNPTEVGFFGYPSPYDQQLVGLCSDLYQVLDRAVYSIAKSSEEQSFK
ncbi:hypothetical protein IFM89_026391 [Coptis chinensis]|uniref:E3 ubiquitin-protein ligase RMA n=1 Tax=Coptis chinensis TaxID=261450 RepID=A0A835I3Q1_9MAGN|nr:hypothetical protein IFM89_026391 [Coptis chinensis]